MGVCMNKWVDGLTNNFIVVGVCEWIRRDKRMSR